MQTLFNISKLLFVGIVIFACTNGNESQVKSPEKKNSNSHLSTEDAWYNGHTTIQGKAQGTSYIIKTSDDSLFITPEETSAFFKAFDDELSTYKSSSLISKFNNNDIGEISLDSTKYFIRSFEVSRNVYKNTNGAFDPTVFPLVEAWGFFKDLNDPPSNSDIDSLLQFIGFQDNNGLVLKNDSELKKLDKRVRLDFNAIAQGQSVDELAEILESRGQSNYFIEVGGEIRAKGMNDRTTSWIIGIDVPKESNDGLSGKRELENYLKLSDHAVATSGSYRKFYVKDGQKYSHTIDPKSGRPVDHNLLSATVIAKEAALADAYATAFMTMGVEETMKFVENNSDLNLEVYLLFENESGRIERAYSSGMTEFFSE